jgi:hypothetical protein
MTLKVSVENPAILQNTRGGAPLKKLLEGKELLK